MTPSNQPSHFLKYRKGYKRDNFTRKHWYSHTFIFIHTHSLTLPIKSQKHEEDAKGPTASRPVTHQSGLEHGQALKCPSGAPPAAGEPRCPCRLPADMQPTCRRCTIDVPVKRNQCATDMPPMCQHSTDMPLMCSKHTVDMSPTYRRCAVDVPPMCHLHASDVPLTCRQHAAGAWLTCRRCAAHTADMTPMRGWCAANVPPTRSWCTIPGEVAFWCQKSLQGCPSRWHLTGAPLWGALLRPAPVAAGAGGPGGVAGGAQ